jgi:hypothetical protein
MEELSYDDADDMFVKVQGRLEKDITVDVPFSELRNMIGEQAFEEAAVRWGFETLKRSTPVFHVDTAKQTVTIAQLLDAPGGKEELWEIDLLKAIKEWFSPQDYIPHSSKDLTTIANKLRAMAEVIEQKDEVRERT